MDCAKAEYLIAAAQNGMLPFQEQSALDEHLADCAACRRHQVTLDHVWKSLDVFPTIEPSADFRTRFWQRVRRDELESGPWWARVLAPRMIPAACGLALWLFGVSGGVLLFESKSDHSGHPNTEAIVLFAEAYPQGSFSQFLLEGRHAH